MIFDFVPFHEVAGDIAKNLDRHYDDVDFKDDYGRPDLDWDSYLNLSLAGLCKVVAVRKEGELIAYSVFCSGKNMNHKTKTEASNCGIWIKKEYRGRLINTLLKKSDEYLKELGIMEVNYILNDDRIGKLLKRVKYQARHIVWSKKL